MGFFDWFSNRGADDIEKREVNFQDIIAALDDLGVSKTKSGAKVTLATALQAGAVFGCARVIAEGCAQLPLELTKIDGQNNRTPAMDTAAHRLLNFRPNSFQTAYEFRENLTMHAVLSRQGMALKTGNSSNPTELLPLMPQWVEIVRNDDWSITYKVKIDGKPVGTFTERQMFVVRGPTWDSHIGADVVRLAREAIGLSLATETTQSTMAKNGSRLSGVLAADQPIGRDRIKEIQEAWKKAMSGVDNSGKVAILDNGFKFHSISQTGSDAQLIETRKFQIEEVCRFMRVFPQMVMSSDKTSTFASSEAFFSAHVTHTLRPWLRRWCGSIERDLLPRQGPKPPFTRALFDTNEMSRPTAEGRGKFYRDVIELGIMTRNEARAREGLARLDGLDEPLTPMNMDQGANSNDDEI